MGDGYFIQCRGLTILQYLLVQFSSVLLYGKKPLLGRGGSLSSWLAVGTFSYPCRPSTHLSSQTLAWHGTFISGGRYVGKIIGRLKHGRHRLAWIGGIFLSCSRHQVLDGPCMIWERSGRHRADWKLPLLHPLIPVISVHKA